MREGCVWRDRRGGQRRGRSLGRSYLGSRVRRQKRWKGNGMVSERQEEKLTARDEDDLLFVCHVLVSEVETDRWLLDDRSMAYKKLNKDRDLYIQPPCIPFLIEAIRYRLTDNDGWTCRSTSFSHSQPSSPIPATLGVLQHVTATSSTTA
jgi:hypothetical protein